MRSTNRLTALAVATSALLFAAPVAAEAAVRVADPNGSGATCDATTPCGIVTAITGAGNGDEVILHTGSYGTTATPIALDIQEGNNIDVHGEAGQPRPVLTSSAAIPLSLFGPTTTLRHLEVQGLNPLNTGALDFSGALLEDFVANAGGVAGRGCQFTKTPIVRNGVCSGTGEGVLLSGTLAAGINPTLRNMTLSGGQAGISVESTTGRPTAGNLVNTIAVGAGGADVILNAFKTDATLTATHSNFSKPIVAFNTAPGLSVLNDDGTNQTAEPLLDGVFHQLTGSPTIDAGLASPDNGSADFDGQVRAQGAAPDIGADEVDVPVDVPLGFDLTAKHKQTAKRLKVTMTCTTNCNAHLTGHGRADGRKLSSRPLDATATTGTAASVRIPFRKKTLKRIGDEKGRLTLTASATDATGHSATDTLGVKLKAAR